MLEKYTAEPWAVSRSGDEARINGPAGEALALFARMDDARRATLCFNWCKGVTSLRLMNTPLAVQVLEDTADLPDMTDALAAIVTRIGDVLHHDAAVPWPREALIDTLRNLLETARNGLA